MTIATATETREVALTKSIRSMDRQIRGVGYIPKRKPRHSRVDRRPRLTWPCWLQDWLKALRSSGWKCCNKIIQTRDTQLGKAQMRKLDVLYMHRKGTVVCLHPVPSKLPKRFSLLDEIDVGSKPNVEKVFHIVRGQRSTHGFDPETPIPYVVEMNGKLYDRYSSSAWMECQDCNLKEVYDEYLKASPHHQSLRNFKSYWTYSKRLAARRAKATSGLLTTLL